MRGRGRAVSVAAAALVGLVAVTPASAAISVRGPATVLEGSAAPVTFTVTRDGVAPASVRLTTRDREAVAPADYAAQDVVVSFAAGETRRQVEVPVAGDRLDEAGESFSVAITTDDAEGIGIGSASTVILDDDPPPQASIAAAQASEGTGFGHGGVLRLPVTLSAPSGREVLVDVTIAGQTATAGEDFGPSGGRLRIAAGVTTVAVEVPVVPDALAEPDETLSATITSPDPDGLGIATATATAEILDDDGVAAPGPDPSRSVPVEAPSETVRAAPKIGRVTRLPRGRSLAVRLTCPSTASGCRGTVAVFNVATPAARRRALRVQRLLARATFTLRRGTSARVTLRATSAGQAALAGAGPVPVTTYVVSRDTTGTLAVGQRDSTLRA